MAKALAESRGSHRSSRARLRSSQARPVPMAGPSSSSRRTAQVPPRPAARGVTRCERSRPRSATGTTSRSARPCIRTSGSRAPASGRGSSRRAPSGRARAKATSAGGMGSRGSRSGRRSWVARRRTAGGNPIRDRDNRPPGHLLLPSLARPTAEPPLASRGVAELRPDRRPRREPRRGAHHPGYGLDVGRPERDLPRGGALRHPGGRPIREPRRPAQLH
jgi:hypothetical protein